MVVTNRRQQAPDALADFPLRYARTARFTGGMPRNLTVTNDGSTVYFCRSRTAEDAVLCLWSLDVEQGTERLLVDPAALSIGSDGLPPAEQARRERARESAAGIVAYSIDSAATRCCFTLGGGLFVLDLHDGSMSSASSTGAVFDPRLDPSGEAVAYTDGGTLRLYELDAGESGGGVDRELRSHEDPLVSHGRAEFVAAEEMQRSRGFWWAPDSSSILATRVDENPVGQWWIGDPAHPERTPNAVRYPAAGTANAAVGLELIDLKGTVRPVDWSDSGRYEYLADVIWEEGHDPLIIRQTRDQREVSIAELDLSRPSGGDPSAPEVTVTERHRIDDDVWVELMPGSPRWCSAGLLTIEDDATARRLFLGGEPITDAGIHVRSILGVVDEGLDEGDEGATTGEGGVVVVSAWTEPTEIHLLGVPLPTSAGEPSPEVVRLTTEPGVHGGALGGSTLVATSAKPDRSGSITSVHRLSLDEQATELGSPSSVLVDHGTDAGFPADPHFCMLGHDDLQSALFLPSWHDGAASLPILLDPYGGPHAQRVLKTHNAHLVSRWFAEHGYAVLVTDGRGTPGRGPAWERAVWGDLATPVLDDQLAALDAICDEHDFLDEHRVAIRGWSFGGYLAALAVLRRPDRFHAAIAGAPVTTWRLYDTHYTERYLGHPAEHVEHYDRSDLWLDGSEGPLLEPLERPLLLIHGLADDNVVAAHSLRFSTALLATGSPHRVLPLSGVTHMTPQEAVASNLLRLQLDFLHETIEPGERYAP